MGPPDACWNVLGDRVDRVRVEVFSWFFASELASQLRKRTNNAVIRQTTFRPMLFRIDFNGNPACRRRRWRSARSQAGHCRLRSELSDGALRRGLLQRVHARRPGWPPRQGRGIDEGRRLERGAHGRIDLEPMGTRGRPIRLCVDGPHCRRHEQGRNQGNPGHANILDPGMDGAPASGDSGAADERRHVRRAADAEHLRHAAKHGHRFAGVPLLC